MAVTLVFQGDSFLPKSFVLFSFIIFVYSLFAFSMLAFKDQDMFIKAILARFRTAIDRHTKREQTQDWLRAALACDHKKMRKLVQKGVASDLYEGFAFQCALAKNRPDTVAFLAYEIKASPQAVPKQRLYEIANDLNEGRGAALALFWDIRKNNRPKPRASLLRLVPRSS